MSKKYKLRRNKRSPIIILFIAIAIVTVIIVMNTGYSLWQTKLNINGNVFLENESTDLEVSIVPTSYGYINLLEASDLDTLSNFTHISDKLENNNLTTTLKVSKNSGDISSKKLKLSFDMKNISNNGHMYTNGTIKNIDKKDTSSAVSNININLSSKNVSEGSIATITYSSLVNLEKITQPVTYKYEISFKIKGKTKYCYYTIVILPYSN